MLNPSKEFEDYLTSCTQKIVETVTEEEDRFIFETIRPFCEEKVQKIIEKKELERALVNYFAPSKNLRFGFCDICGTRFDNAAIRGRGEFYCVGCGKRYLNEWGL